MNSKFRQMGSVLSLRNTSKIKITKLHRRVLNGKRFFLFIFRWIFFFAIIIRRFYKVNKFFLWKECLKGLVCMERGGGIGTRKEPLKTRPKEGQKLVVSKIKDYFYNMIRNNCFKFVFSIIVN